MEYLYRQAVREFVFSQDSTSTDDLLDEKAEGFVDDSMSGKKMNRMVKKRLMVIMRYQYTKITIR